MQEPLACLISNYISEWKVRQRDPPSVFHDVPKSLIPTRPAKPRTMNRSILTITNRQELEEFNMRDRIDFDCLESHLASESFFHPALWYKISIQSCTFFTDSIPLFVIQLSDDFKYETFHAGVKCTMSQNRSTTLDSISKLKEAIQYLSLLPFGKKKL